MVLRALVFGAFGFRQLSNELDQFHRYRNITIQTWSNDSIHFLTTNDCHNDDHGLIAECWTASMKGNASLFPTLWTPDMQKSPDCAYNLIETELGLKRDSIHVIMEIQQSKCRSGTLIEGGASFSVLAHNDKYIVSCGVIDLFNNSYVVSCVLPLPPLSINNISANHQNRTCVTIDVNLEHEHYDAFGREGGIHVPVGITQNVVYYHIIENLFLCASDSLQQSNNSTSISTRYAHISKALSGSGLDLGWGKNSNSNSTHSPKRSSSAAVDRIVELVQGIWTRPDPDSMRGEHAENDHPPYYKWTIRYHHNPLIFPRNHTGANSNMKATIGANKTAEILLDRYRIGPSQQQYDQCRARQSNVLVGESHMRFTWNWLAYRYYDGQRQFLDALARKHEDVSFHHLNLSQKYFVDQLVPVLDKLVCSLEPDPAMVAMVIQTGYWDLSYMPLSAVLTNPQGASALIAAIDRMERRGCSKSVRLVVAMTMPCPDCAPLCTNFQPSRNNHAIGALNQYFYSQLIRQNGTLLYSNLAIVDSLSIIEPNKKYAVCINHFLCRHGDRQQFRIESTPPGEALAATIAAALCYHQ